MRIPPRITLLGGTVALVSALFVGGPVAAPASAVASVPAAASASAYVGEICSSALPSQARETLELIDKGGPFPHSQDGTVFSNREGVLPSQSSGYYHEYTVETPGSPTRGARRIVTGQESQEDYYTSDHYQSFDRVDFGC